MKAVLEFAYPDDEYELKHAMKGCDYYDALCEIENIMSYPFTKAEAYNRIKALVRKALDEA